MGDCWGCDICGWAEWPKDFEECPICTAGRLKKETQRLKDALIEIADKKTDTSGAHSMRAIKIAKKALGVVV